MNDLIQKLKTMKNSTQGQIDSFIKEQSYKNVVKDLKEAGIDESELSDEEFKQLLAEEISKNKTFAKGALVGAGFLMFLDLIG
jgi:tripartite-type tricarboxylate transporter receptor subunit TctC